MSETYKPRFFQESEFRRCTPKCELSDMDSDFMRLLDKAREIAQVPFILSSAYRTKEHEIKKGRPGTSSHTKGLAVDISCKSTFVRYKILNALFSVGFRRIGVYSSFIHVDNDGTKISAVWLDPKVLSAEL